MSVVLIVDDEPGFLQITQIVLKKAGYTTLTARDGFEGLRVLEEHVPDLIILDEMMPGMSGSDVCLQVKSTPHLQHIPVIMHTASIKLKHDTEHIQAIGANAVLIKPTMPAEMLALIERFIPAQV